MNRSSESTPNAGPASRSLPEFASVARVAEILSVSPRTVHRLIERGKLRAKQLSPGCTRVRLDSLREMLEENA